MTRQDRPKNQVDTIIRSGMLSTPMPVPELTSGEGKRAAGDDMLQYGSMHRDTRRDRLRVEARRKRRATAFPRQERRHT